MLGIGRIAHLPIGAEPYQAALRLSLRTAQARFEVCRERTAVELAALPAHMRQARACEEIAVDYRLTVHVDGASRLERTVTHRGVRHTRPLVLDESLAVEPGPRHLDVRFTPLVGPLPAAAATPRSYSFTGELDFTRGRIRLARIEGDRLVLD